MSIANASPFAALGAPTIAPDGREVVVLLVKATFVIVRGGKLALGDEQMPIRTGDVPRSLDAVDSSILFPNDVGLEKKGVDVVIVGEAISPKPVRVMDVGVRIGERTVPLRVHGERVYYRAGARVAVGPAAPFERKAISYENAYGGATPDYKRMERRNPVGRGVAHSESDLVDTKAPSIEHPAEPITSAADAPAPVGYGAISTHWGPRCDYAGTFDDVWRTTRLPLLPLDFDPRFWNVAHPSLQLPALPPRTPIAVIGMREEGVLQLELPELQVIAHGRTDDGRSIEARPSVDTVLIVPNEGPFGPPRVELSLRVVFPRGRGRTSLREIRVSADD